MDKTCGLKQGNPPTKIPLIQVLGVYRNYNNFAQIDPPKASVFQESIGKKWYPSLFAQISELWSGSKSCIGSIRSRRSEPILPKGIEKSLSTLTVFMPCVSRIRMISSISSVRTHVPASVKLGSYQLISLPKLKQVGGIQLAISRLKCFAHPRDSPVFYWIRHRIRVWYNVLTFGHSTIKINQMQVYTPCIYIYIDSVEISRHVH